MSELIGLDDYYDGIIRQFYNKSLVCAMLFSGIEGIGKKKLAFKIASSILCINDSIKKLFEASTLPDFLFIDSKSQIKVDDIEKVVLFANEKPLYSNNKVVIINDAHKMNENAQNKLLKTLEDAPKFMYIILITSKPSMLLDTIISRVVEYSFPAFSKDFIKKNLPQIYSEELLETAACFSGGSFLRAYNILENEEEIALMDIPSIIIEALINKDRIEIVEIISKYDDYEIEKIIDYLYIWIRDILAIKSNADIFFKNKADDLSRQGKSLNIEMIDSINKSIINIKKYFEANINLKIAFNASLLSLLEEK